MTIEGKYQRKGDNGRLYIGEDTDLNPQHDTGGIRANHLLDAETIIGQ